MANVRLQNLRNFTMQIRRSSKEDECYSLAYQAWVAHLHGDLETAGEAFRQAEVLNREIDPDTHYLHSLWGIWHADHLRRTGDADYSRRLTETNLEICERNRWTDDLSRCHRVLGDLDADALRQAPSTGSGRTGLSGNDPSTDAFSPELAEGSGRTGLIESARGHYDEALKIAQSISRHDVLIEALLRGDAGSRALHMKLRQLSATCARFWIMP